MIRLNIVVEGQTEEAFVRDLLGPHLASFGVGCSARCAQTGRKRGKVFKGGVLDYEQFRHDLVDWMKQDQRRDAFFSTLIDLYRLPSDFPGYEAAADAPDVYARVETLEDAFSKEIRHHLGHFVPHIQPYEFEALLFSRPAVLAAAFPREPEALKRLQDTASHFDSPEHINDDDPPSKRLLALLPEYDKVGDGPFIATSIGLDTIRSTCQHFDRWLRKLECLSGMP